MTEEVLIQLLGFKELTVLGRETTRSIPATADPASMGRELVVRYVLEGSLRIAGPELRVTSRLVEAGSDAVLWARTYTEDLRARSMFAVQEDIAQQVASAVAQPYGVIFQTDLRKTANLPPDDLEAYACTLRFYLYRAELSPELHALVRGCLKRAVSRFPGYSTAWAMLSLVEIDEERFQFNDTRGETAPPIERALAAARRAVALDADNVRALQALTLALFFHGDVEAAVRVGELALSSHPNDSELLSEFGLRVAMTGEWQRGRELVEQAFARNPANSGYYHAVLALIAYMQGDQDVAIAEIRQANLEKFPDYHGVAAVVYARAGLLAEARTAAARFAQLRPAFVANLDAELARRNMRAEDRTRLANDLRRAGLLVPDAAAAGGPPGPS
jgi:adenylate cyclase